MIAELTVYAGVVLCVVGAVLGLVAAIDLIRPGGPGDRAGALGAILFLALPLVLVGGWLIARGRRKNRSNTTALDDGQGTMRRLIRIARFHEGRLSIDQVAEELEIDPEIAERELLQAAMTGLAWLEITHEGEMFFDFRESVLRSEDEELKY